MTTPKFIAGAVEYFESGQADPLFCTAGVAATGPDKLVLATIVHSNGYPAKTISQVKFGNNGSNMTAGVAMTQVPSGTVADDSVGLRTSMYYLAVGDAPITASQSASGVAVDLNAVADENAILVRVYERVDQTTPTGTATAQHTDNATSYSANVASVAGDLVVDGLYVWDGTTSASAPTQGAGQTKILNDTVEGLTGLTFVASEEVATGTTTTMSWTGYSAISAGSTHVGVALKGNGLSILPMVWYYANNMGD